jgi:hypothetical protein
MDMARFLHRARGGGLLVNPRSTLSMATLVLLSVNLVGCELAKGIFKAGVWVGILGVLGLVLLVALATGVFRR